MVVWQKRRAIQAEGLEKRQGKTYPGSALVKVSREEQLENAPSEDHRAGHGFLINRNFAWLALGQAISNVGDLVFSTTLLIWIFTLTHSAAAVSGVLAAQYIPVFLLGPFAGVFVDRWNRRQTMLISDLIRAGAATLPLVAPTALQLPVIYTSVFLISTLGRFFMPAEAGLMQVIVTEQQQTQAASIKQATFALSFILGPALASPLYFAVGPTTAILLNAASYLVSAFSLARLRASKAAFHPYAFQPHDTADSGVHSVIHQLWAGFRFMLGNRLVLMVTLMALISMLGAGTLGALNIVFANRNLHIQAASYGLLAGLGGAGGLCGVILAGLLSRRIGGKQLLCGSALLIGIGFVIYSLQSWYVAGLVVNFFMSLPLGSVQVAFAPLLINATRKDMMGRVQAVVDTSMSGASLISVVLAGYLGQVFPVSVILAGCGALIAAAGVFGWLAIPGRARAPDAARA